MAEESSLKIRLMCLPALTVRSSDPDFFVPEGTNISTIVDEANFTFRTGVENGASSAPNDKFAGNKTLSTLFPALAGLGLSYVVFDFLPGDMKPLHTHPGGTEILCLLGSLSVTLIDTTNELGNQSNLQAEDLFVCPNGLVHHQSDDDSAQATRSQGMGSLEQPKSRIPSHSQLSFWSLHQL